MLILLSIPPQVCSDAKQTLERESEIEKKKETDVSVWEWEWYHSSLLFLFLFFLFFFIIIIIIFCFVFWGEGSTYYLRITLIWAHCSSFALCVGRYKVRVFYPQYVKKAVFRSIVRNHWPVISHASKLYLFFHENLQYILYYIFYFNIYYIKII